MNKPIKYICPKCGSKTFVTSEISTSGHLLTRILNIQNRRFTSVTCSECKYTELYNLSPKRLGDVLDIPEKTDKLHRLMK